MGKYHMRRQDRQVNDSNELDEMLLKGKYAVIAMCRDNEPYIVSLSYGYDKDNHALYFHSGFEGLKIDFLKYNPRVCATIVEDKGYILNECAHEYGSVVIFGDIAFMENPKEKVHGMKILLNHLEENPQPIMDRALKNEEMYKKTAILKLSIAEMTGKKGR